MNIICTNELNLKSNIDSFFSYIDVSNKTQVAYKDNIRLFCEYINWDNKPTREQIVEYKEYLIKNFKPTTVNARLIAVKQFFKWLSYERIYPNIAENIKQVPVGNIDKNYPTVDEVKIIIKSIDNSYDLALFTLLITTGLRLKEVSNADIEDLKELHGENVLYVLGKGRVGKEEYVKISNSVLSNLKSHIGGKTSGAIFLSTSNNNRGERASTRALYNRVKAIYKKAGIDEKKFTVHALRGSFSVMAMENGASIYDVSKVLRHKDVHTTECYLRSLDRSKNKTEYLVSDLVMGV